MHNYILKDENAVYFECGYSCDNEIFIKFGDKRFFITDSRYAIEARARIENSEIIESKDIIKSARVLLRSLGVRDMVFNPSDFSHFEFANLSRDLHLNFKPKNEFSKLKRQIKSSLEIEILRHAAQLGASKFDELSKIIKEGMSEKLINFNAENILRDSGNLALSFDPITAINANAAKAHALPLDERIKNGDLLLVDAGVKYQRYCSDRTRTVEFGDKFEFSKEQKFTNSKQNEIYHIVKEAQSLAIKAAKPGVKACDIDAAARNFIVKNGYGDCFFHSTGHGVGLDIHEFPIISPRSSTIIEPGMVFSIEPGIYIEGEFGVRIEDVVVITNDGCEVL
ncbi:MULTISPECIES: M24 family metallopeptidase [Campylobacter]|uniref:M24 family metallopeptidase n=1 Tax=Campylobacter TaxID=194 RepID=UPI00254E6F59|nr:MULTISPECIES: M24 family metallopeptidase [Campylobacter]MBQ8609646.1 aminopeptidase P family protein [Campylobacter sp.]MDL0104435.1 aminopeptidase P family protein [Campylobacter ovis]MDL0106385.1 aminopeptidase P family protein [Campylobacter ovis]